MLANWRMTMKSAIERVRELFEAHIHTKAKLPLIEALAAEIEAAENRAAALELALRTMKDLDIKSRGRCPHNTCQCPQCIADAALRDHVGALATHDAEVRKTALLEAAERLGEIPTFTTGEDQPKYSTAFGLGVWLRKLAKEEPKT
jgi:hypothetical protein